jgi:hypothetical protein
MSLNSVDCEFAAAGGETEFPPPLQADNANHAAIAAQPVRNGEIPLVTIDPQIAPPTDRCRSAIRNARFAVLQTHAQL